ncbi:response regulator [Salinarimonas soli]|uniref:Response regulator n=1 Tax=Salinarimonas soli TaxID=1638099 RepID=A0A5B2VH99_9HYPH|nr:response regulator [Salinarimonas soli]KAA2237988.1 response regulator [Salinarimonas soli]
MMGAPARRVLVVEDEALLRDVVAQEMRDHGYEVEEAETGEIAVAMLERCAAFDALFTDIRLPGSVDGWQVAKAFRARFPAAPVFYATGYSSTRDEVDRSMFFRKPFKLPQLILCLKAQLGETPADP